MKDNNEVCLIIGPMQAFISLSWLAESENLNLLTLYGKVSLSSYHHLFVWIQLLCLCSMNSNLFSVVKFKKVKHEVIRTVIHPPMVSVLWLNVAAPYITTNCWRQQVISSSTLISTVVGSIPVHGIRKWNIITLVLNDIKIWTRDPFSRTYHNAAADQNMPVRSFVSRVYVGEN